MTSSCSSPLCRCSTTRSCVSDGAWDIEYIDTPAQGPESARKRPGHSAMICIVEPRFRRVLAGCALLAAACTLASCSTPAARRAAPKTTSTSAPTTTTTTTSPPTTVPPTTLPQGVGVPNVLGMKIDLAHFYLKMAGFSWVPLNAPCSKGTLPSQSVVASLSIPGRPPNVTVGAQPLLPGTLLAKGSQIGLTWSGCYPAGTTVPQVTGRTFASAVHLLHLAGLNWACYSVGPDPTSTTTSTTAASTSTTAPLPTTTTATTATPPARVLSQGTKAGTAAQAGAVVVLVMHHCPQ